MQTLENGAHSVATPLQRLKHLWRMPVAYLVIPVFALANVGIPIELASIGNTSTDPIMLGVAFGLPPRQVHRHRWLMLKFGRATLPKDTSFSQIPGVSLLARIGFTMPPFFAQLGFEGREELLLTAQTGILAAWLRAGAIGFIWLCLAGKPK